MHCFLHSMNCFAMKHTLYQAVVSFHKFLWKLRKFKQFHCRATLIFTDFARYLFAFARREGEESRLLCVHDSELRYKMMSINEFGVEV